MKRFYQILLFFIVLLSVQPCFCADFDEAPVPGQETLILNEEDLNHLVEREGQKPLSQSTIINPTQGFQAQYKDRFGNEHIITDLNKVLGLSFIHEKLKATGNGVKVKIYDGGFDVTHPDLRDFLTYSALLHVPTGGEEFVSHGTSVAQIIHYVAPRITFGSPLQDFGEDIVKYAKRIEKNNDNVNLINVSLSLSVHDEQDGDVFEVLTEPIEEDVVRAIDQITRAGKLVVMSAGNHGLEGASTSYFKSLLALANQNPRMILVGALEYSDNLERLSSFSIPANDYTDRYISAPGTHIRVALKKDQYGVQSGTSFAAPIVTGVLGLLIEVFPYWRDTPEKYIDHLLKYTRKVTLDNYPIEPSYGQGILDPRRALKGLNKLKKKWIDRMSQNIKDYFATTSSPSMEELTQYLRLRLGNQMPQSFIDEFVVTLIEENNIIHPIPG